MFAQNRQIAKRFMTKCCSGLLGVILLLSAMSGHVLGQLAPGVQEGDLFVGAASPAGPRGVFRLRDGVVTPFSLGSANANDPGFFDVPHGVIVDSQGRVVWLAPIGDIAARNYANHVGLFRASGEGATPERLATFRVGNHALDQGYPNPFPDLRIANYSGGPPVVGLHLASNRRIEIDDDVEGGKPRVVTEEAYVMGLIRGAGSGVGDFTGAKTVSYGATTGVWDDSLPDPIYTPQRYPPADIVSHAGAIYSIDNNGLRRSSTPLRVDASGSIDLGPAGNIEFSLGLRLFGGDQNLRAVILDDKKIENVPCECAVGAPDPPHHSMPWEPGFSPMSGFQSLAYDPVLGLVISSNAGFAGPYLIRVGGPLLNDDPNDDIDAYFYQPLAGDLPTPSLDVTRMVAKGQFGDPDSGIGYPTNSSVMGAPGGGGLVALQSGSGSVLRVMENGRVEVLATDLSAGADLGTGALGSYPTYSSPATGLSVIIRVDSPVDVLLTAPDGRRIGVDPATGQRVNDFGENGFDSGPGEPRFFGIKDSAPGDWDIDMVGTDDGPFAINVYGINLDEPIGDRDRLAGAASLDRRLATAFSVDAAANVQIFPLGDFNIDADGNWSTADNWTGGVPNATGARAVFGGVITQPRRVTLDIPVTVRRIDFDNPNGYTITGTNTLTLDATSGNAQINVHSGSHVIGAPVTLADDTEITVAAASNLLISGGLNAAGANLTKVGAGTLTVNNIRAKELVINGGNVTMAPGGGASVMGSLSIAGTPAAPTAKLDLSNNAAIVDYPAAGPSPAPTIRQQIIAGRGGAGLGKPWNGPGITSSTAQADVAASPNSRSVGYAENAALPLGAYTNFRGHTVDATSILMAYTRSGDVNLDGVVNDDDVTVVGTFYAPGVPKPDWAKGDFDYNGFVDDDDVTLLGVFYNPSAPPLVTPAPGSGSDLAAVPEPSTYALVVAAFAFMGLCSVRCRAPTTRGLKK